MTPEHFAEHLDVLRKLRRVPLSAVEPSRYALPGAPSIVVTFDDGYADNFTAAVPLLLRYDTPATFFIATGYIGAPSGYWWDELEHIVFASKQGIERYQHLYNELRPLSPDARRQRLDHLYRQARPTTPAPEGRRPMTLPELQKIAAEPLFEIGAHTVTHPLLAARPIEEQHKEIQASKAYLETRLNRPIQSFSYPYGGKGHYVPATVDAVRHCGFHRACTTEAHPVRRGDGPLEIARLNVTDMNGDAFQQFLCI